MTDHTSIPASEDSTLSKTLLGRRRVLAFGLGAAALGATLVLGSRSERKNRPHIPITLRDLIEAAATQRWPVSYPRA